MARKDAARKDAAYNPKLKELHKEKQLLLSNASHTDKDKQIDIINKKIAEELLSFQRIGLEKEISSLKSISKSKGVTAAIFKLKDKVVGMKKRREMQCQ